MSSAPQPPVPPVPPPPQYKIKKSNSNIKFFKAALPFLAFVGIGSFFLQKFQSEKIYVADKKRNSMSVAEMQRREEALAKEMEVRDLCCCSPDSIESLHTIAWNISDGFVFISCQMGQHFLFAFEQRIQEFVSRDWVQVPIPGSRDDPNAKNLPPPPPIRELGRKISESDKP